MKNGFSKYGMLDLEAVNRPQKELFSYSDTAKMAANTNDCLLHFRSVSHVVFSSKATAAFLMKNISEDTQEMP